MYERDNTRNKLRIMAEELEEVQRGPSHSLISNPEAEALHICIGDCKPF